MSVSPHTSKSLAQVDPAQIPLSQKIVALLGESARVHPLILQSLFIRAARGERLALVVGDNHFDVYRLARLARAHGFDPAVVLARLELSRPFTCHQLHHRIVTLASQPTPPWQALYVIGLLDTFYDEDVRVPDAARLVQKTLTQLKTIAAHGLPILLSMALPPAVSIASPYSAPGPLRDPSPGLRGQTGDELSKHQDRGHFVELVKRAADAYWQPSPALLEQFEVHQLHLAGI